MNFYEQSHFLGDIHLVHLDSFLYHCLFEMKMYDRKTFVTSLWNRLKILVTSNFSSLGWPERHGYGHQ